jgi:hypothetical protein
LTFLMMSHANESNHAMERTADRRMTRLKEELRIMKQATCVDSFVPDSVTATLRGLAVYPESSHASVFSSAVAHLVLVRCASDYV